MIDFSEGLKIERSKKDKMKLLKQTAPGWVKIMKRGKKKMEKMLVDADDEQKIEMGNLLHLYIQFQEGRHTASRRG